MIENAVNRVTYQGDGQAVEFAFTFEVIEKSDVVVVTVSPENVEKTLTSDYFVDMDKKVVRYPGYPPGEEPPEAERPPILPAGWKLVIYRSIAMTQEESLGDVWPFNLIEDGLDKLTMIVQDLFEKIQRTVKISVATPEDVDTTLPIPKANTVFGWDTEGKRIINKEDPSYYTAQSKQFAEQASQSASDAQNANTAAESNAESARNSASSAANAEASAASSKDESKSYRDEAEAFAKTAQGASAPAWDENASYRYPDVVAGPDGKTYRATADINPGERPGESEKWMPLTVDLTSDFWEVDKVGDVMPASVIPYSHGKGWELDGSGNIMPENVGEIPGAPDDSWRAATNSEISNVFKEV